MPEFGRTVPAEQVDQITASVLTVMSGRTECGPATIAMLAGIDLNAAIRCLGLLAAVGYAERCDTGWRTRGLEAPSVSGRAIPSLASSGRVWPARIPRTRLARQSITCRRKRS